MKRAEGLIIVQSRSWTLRRAIQKCDAAGGLFAGGGREVRRVDVEYAGRCLQAAGAADHEVAPHARFADCLDQLGGVAGAKPTALTTTS